MSGTTNQYFSPPTSFSVKLWKDLTPAYLSCFILQLSALLFAPHTVDFCSFPKSILSKAIGICFLFVQFTCTHVLVPCYILTKSFLDSTAFTTAQVNLPSYKFSQHPVLFFTYDPLYSYMIICLVSVFSMNSICYKGRAVYKDPTYWLVSVFAQKTFNEWMMISYILCN